MFDYNYIRDLIADGERIYWELSVKSGFQFHALDAYMVKDGGNREESLTRLDKRVQNAFTTNPNVVFAIKLRTSPQSNQGNIYGPIEFHNAEANPTVTPGLSGIPQPIDFESLGYVPQSTVTAQLAGIQQQFQMKLDSSLQAIKQEHKQERMERRNRYLQRKADKYDDKVGLISDGISKGLGAISENPEILTGILGTLAKVFNFKMPQAVAMATAAQATQPGIGNVNIQIDDDEEPEEPIFNDFQFAQYVDSITAELNREQKKKLLSVLQYGIDKLRGQSASQANPESDPLETGTSANGNEPDDDSGEDDD